MTVDPTQLYEYSYSGADTVAFIYFENAPDIVKKLDTLHTISISLHEAKGPARALGYKGVKGYARSLRTIAGSMVLTIVQDNPLKALNQMLIDLWDRVADYNPGWSLDMHEIGTGTALDQNNEFANRIAPLYPPFNLLLIHVSEGSVFGRDLTASQLEYLGIDGAATLIRGIEFIDDSVTHSVMNIVSENNLSYVACDYKPISLQTYLAQRSDPHFQREQQRQTALYKELFGNADTRQEETRTRETELAIPFDDSLFNR